MLDQIRKRHMPVVGDGGAIRSFMHIDDAAQATVAAVEGGAPGIYNIVDDEPATVASWLPAGEAHNRRAVSQCGWPDS